MLLQFRLSYHNVSTLLYDLIVFEYIFSGMIYTLEMNYQNKHHQPVVHTDNYNAKLLFKPEKSTSNKDKHQYANVLAL
ncbi:hypothetical protein DWY54_22390 [Parabacteroides distasonis]|nr:hypothetical protein DWY54_22390 [Parabacteroides distasonis]RHK51633.1 hypothetical protein DW056_20300 [Parabacteroides distasonis]